LAVSVPKEGSYWNSSSGRGIGRGDGRTVDLLHFSGNVTVKRHQLQASSILLSDGSLLSVTDQSLLFVGDRSIDGTIDLTILLSCVTFPQIFS
jgi:hypothetical protein